MCWLDREPCREPLHTCTESTAHRREPRRIIVIDAPSGRQHKRPKHADKTDTYAIHTRTV
jgi:hypothetical protein